MYHLFAIIDISRVFLLSFCRFQVAQFSDRLLLVILMWLLLLLSSASVYRNATHNPLEMSDIVYMIRMITFLHPNTDIQFLEKLFDTNVLLIIFNFPIFAMLPNDVSVAYIIVKVE